MTTFGTGTFGAGTFGNPSSSGGGGTPTSALFPGIICEVAFGSNPLSSPVWTDVSSYVRSFSLRRGRQTELDRFEAGIATLVLDNLGRQFDPTHTGSPYYPNVIPGRRVRLRAVWSSTTYDLFTGFVNAWNQNWSVNGKDASCVVQASDGLALLNLPRITTSYVASTGDTRLNNVLNTTGWPIADRNFDVGASALQASTLTDEPALSHMQTVNETEVGRLFVAGDGRVTFVGRNDILLPPYDTVSASFGDGGGSELPYRDLVLAYDDTKIWTEVTIQRISGVAQTASDATAISTYGKRTFSAANLLYTTDNDSLSAAQYRLGQYKDAHLRIESMVFTPARSAAAMWPIALGLEIGYRINVRRRPPGGGTMISQESLIEGIEHVGAPKIWETRYWLSAADTSQYWLLGDSTKGVLGSTTRLAF